MEQATRFSRLFISLLIPIFFISSNTDAQTFRGIMPVWIKNNSGSPMSGVQVRLSVNTQVLISLGLMQANGNDIRFGTPCGNTPTTPYDYFIEGYMNTDSTKIWVLPPTVPANDSVLIFMFFGNSSVPAGSTLSIFSGPHSSTDSVMVANTNTVSNCQRGFRFAPTQNLIVTHFGKRTPNATQRYVTLFDFNSQQIVMQAQVDAGSPGVWNYNALTNAIVLNQGQQYLLELYNGTGDMYYYGTSSQIGQHLTYYDMRYCNSCTQNTFPTSVLSNYHYGTPDFLYYIYNTVTPAPGYSLRPPADTNTPAAPTNLTGVAGNQQALLRWNRNLEFDVWRYLIYRNTTNNPNTAALIDSVVHPDTTYLATGLTNGTTYYFWVRAKDRYCAGNTGPFSSVVSITPLAVGKIENEIPKVFALHQNYPNPFNPVTSIKFDIPKAGLVTLTVYDVAGREVDVPVSEYLAAGYYEVTFDAGDLASGVYIYKLEAGSFTDRKKMIVVK